LNRAAADECCTVEGMKLRVLCKSKIHRAIVTSADLNYVGSIGIDSSLMRLTDILPGERVSVWNINNGQRIETYALALPDASGQVVVNGAAARHFHAGDPIIIVAFCMTDEPITPQMIAVDEHNRFVQYLEIDEGVIEEG
jgi:aspartate 1-decarboxylase